MNDYNLVRGSNIHGFEDIRIARLVKHYNLTQFIGKTRIITRRINGSYLSDRDRSMSKEEATTIVEAWLLEHI